MYLYNKSHTGTVGWVEFSYAQVFFEGVCLLLFYNLILVIEELKFHTLQLLVDQKLKQPRVQNLRIIYSLGVLHLTLLGEWDPELGEAKVVGVEGLELILWWHRLPLLWIRHIQFNNNNNNNVRSVIPLIERRRTLHK